jgi:predicted GNAT superfamily acetyltransferase
VAESGAMSDPATRRGAADDGTAFRRLTSQDDYAACVELQRRTWGRRFRELVPPSVIKVSQRVGGVAAGAFDPAGNLLGFVLGLTGVRPPRGAPAAPQAGARPPIVHWSHMLAVAPEARDRGLGTRLKLYQRELLLPLGVDVVEWTYDPLEARNAHLNLNHLGGEVAEYVEDMYRGEMGSVLARGIGTDRFIVAWRIASDRVAAALAARPPAPQAVAERFALAPVVGLGGGPPLPEAPRVRVEIPPDIQTLKAAQAEPARQWRLRTRLAFTTYLGRGWRVEAFYREPGSGRCFYGLERSPGAESAEGSPGA